MKTYTRSQLALRNGQDKPEIWVAFQGLIYDMTESKLWKNGKHYEHWAGQDLTPELADAPHSEKVFEKFIPHRNPSSMILIVESGSTKTAWRLIKDPASAYESFSSAGINPYYQTTEEITTAQQSVLSGFKELPIQAIYYYGTGVTSEAQCEVIAAAFRPYFPSTCSLEIQNDLIAAARSLCGKEAGIACILGTGSNSGFWDGGRISAQIPPLGFWLGDEGSGGHLGKLVLLSYLHGQMPVEVRAVFEKRFGVLDRLTVLDKAYKQAFPNRWFASFSKFLFDHRRDAYCYGLIEQSFEAFISLYLKRYTEAPVVHFTGSVAFYYSDILKKILKKHGLNVGHISEGPMAGLCLYHKGNFGHNFVNCDHLQKPKTTNTTHCL